VVTLSLLAGCTQSASERGEALFSDSALSSAASNPFSCATCHDVTPTPTRLAPGYSLYDVVHRPSYWGGPVTNLLQAVNLCLVDFMRGRALSPDEVDGRALLAYLERLSPSPASPALPLTVVRDIADVPSGDPQQGEAFYAQACGNCHGAPHTGDGRLSDRVSIIPDETIANHGTDPRTGARLILIEKVRHGRYFGVFGNMPPFSLEALPDQTLGAILGYLEGFGLPPAGP
jgi:thiosulfate dehydrogenase